MTAYRSLTRYQDLDDTKNLSTNQVLVPNGSGGWIAEALPQVPPNQDVRDFGAKADARILTDAVMTTGSPTLTSASNPFASTDVGKVVYVLDAAGTNTPLKSTIQSFQNSGQVTLANSATNNSRMDGGPNPNAVFGSPNVTAFNNAFAAAQAAALPVSGATSRWSARSNVYVSGSYLLEGPLTPITASGIGLIGTGTYSTFLFYCESSALISLDTFNSNPSSLYGGTAARFKATALSIVNPMKMAYEGSRSGIAIQDNGCGDLTVSDVMIQGFQYGICGSYGSDFDRIVDSRMKSCDVGIYFGPGSQQLQIEGVEFYYCREGLVTDGVAQSRTESCWFINSKVVDIQHEELTTSRLGLVGKSPVTFNNSLLVTESCWFESAAGADTSRIATNGHVRTYSNTGDNSYPRGVRVLNPYLVAGGSVDPTRSFWTATSGKFLRLEGLLVNGSAIGFAMDAGNATAIYQRETRTLDGYPTVGFFNNPTVACHYEGNETGPIFRGRGTNAYIEQWMDHPTAPAAIRYLINADSTLSLFFWNVGGSNWIERIKFDLQGSKISLGTSYDTNVYRAFAGGLKTDGGFVVPVTTKTANYTAAATDSIVLADATSGVVTITLPTAVGITGRQYTIKRTNTAANNVTIATTSSQTIDGATTYVITNPKETVIVVSDGANWQVV